MLFLRSLLFNIVYLVWTLFCCLAFLPFLLIGGVVVQHVGRPWANGLFGPMRYICGIKSDVRGKEHLTPRPVIYALKHQSAWDIIMVLALINRPTFVLKKELLWLPFYGLYLWRMRMIAIDRSGGRQALKQMKKHALASLHNGRPIVIFPEGTRTAPGTDTHYHPGVGVLYTQMNVPVVPVALNSGLLWRKNAFIKKPGTLTIEFLPAIEPGLPHKEFMETVRSTIETATAALINEETQRNSHATIETTSQ